MWSGLLSFLFSPFFPFCTMGMGWGGNAKVDFDTLFRQALCCFYCFGFGMMDGWRIEFGLR